MSVAFRRESDDEHLEPKFELPIPPGPNLVTARGLELLEAKVAELEAALPAITEEEPRKKHLRDLRYWRNRLATAELREARTDGVVGFGSRVELLLSGKRRVIELVGHDEAEPAAGKLAFTAPLARAVMGPRWGICSTLAGKKGRLRWWGLASPLHDTIYCSISRIYFSA